MDLAVKLIDLIEVNVTKWYLPLKMNRNEWNILNYSYSDCKSGANLHFQM